MSPAPFSGPTEHPCAQPGGGQKKQMSGQGGWPRGLEAGEVSEPGLLARGLNCVCLTFVHSFIRSFTQLWFPEPQLCAGHGPKRDQAGDKERTGSWAVAARVLHLASEAGILLVLPYPQIRWWASHLASLSLSVFTCKMGLMIVSRWPGDHNGYKSPLANCSIQSRQHRLVLKL